MAKVQATKTGYYNHRRIRAGEVFEMSEVDKDCFYVDDKGKPKKFPKFDVAGKLVAEEERKCRWVIRPGSVKSIKADPKEVAAVISGRMPGVAKPLGEKE